MFGKNEIFFLLFIYLFLIYIFQNLKKCQLNIFDELWYCDSSRNWKPTKSDHMLIVDASQNVLKLAK